MTNRTRSARGADHVRVARAAERDRARRLAADDLVPEERGAFFVDRAHDEMSFVDPDAVVANVALVEDGNAVVRDPAEYAPRGADEPPLPRVEIHPGELRDIGQRRDHAGRRRGGMLVHPRK